MIQLSGFFSHDLLFQSRWIITWQRERFLPRTNIPQASFKNGVSLLLGQVDQSFVADGTVQMHVQFNLKVFQLIKEAKKLC